MTGVLGIATSALQAQSKSVSTTANNIANVTTDGFRADRVVFSSNDPEAGGGVQSFQITEPNDAPRTGLDAPIIGQSNVELDTEFVNLIQADAAFQAALSTIRADDENFDSLIDILA